MRRSVTAQLAAQPPVDVVVLKEPVAAKGAMGGWFVDDQTDALAAIRQASAAVAPEPETVWTAKNRRMTNDEVIERLETAPASKRVPGRTLLKGHTWDGRDLPGRGTAAQRRLRQIARGQHQEGQR